MYAYGGGRQMEGEGLLAWSGDVLPIPQCPSFSPRRCVAQSIVQPCDSMR